MKKPSRAQKVCSSCGRHVTQHQSDLAEELGKCPYCGKPLVPVRKYDPDAEIIIDRNEIDEEEPPGSH
jgi:DNA-directed RNA polymerase subunit RPC12/RpoP